MMDNEKKGNKLMRIASNIVADGYKEMTDEIAEEHNVVAAECCYHCNWFEDSGDNDEGNCDMLDCRTCKTDVCKHYIKQ